MLALLHHPRLLAATALFLLLALVYSFSIGMRATRGASITGDEPFYLLTTQSLLQDGDLDLKQQYERESYKSFFDHPDGLWRQSVQTSDGQLLSPHEPGLSVLLIPGFALDGLQGVQVQILLITALTFALAFVFADLQTGTRLLSWLVTAAVGLSASAFVYSTEIYPEVPGALCLVISLLLLRTGTRDWRAAAALVLLLSALLWLGMKYAPLGGLVALAFLLQADVRGRLTLVSLGAISAAFYVWFHYAVFEDLTAYSVNTVYEGADAASVLRSHVSFEDRAYRLWGLFIDRRFGVGRWAPLLLLTLPSLPLLLKGGSISRLVLGLVGVQLLIATFVAITMMGWWFPGRTLMVVLPLLPVSLTMLVASLPAAGKVVAMLLAAVSLSFTLALQRASSAGEIRIAVDPFDMETGLFRTAAWLFPNYQQWTGETVVLTALWLTLLGLALGGVVWRSFGSKLSLAYAGVSSRRLRSLSWIRG